MDLNARLEAKAPPPSWARTAAAARASRPRHGLRWAMYLSFIALAAGVALQTALIWQLEQMRAADVAILDLAGEQRVQAHEVGHQASLLNHDMLTRADSADALAALLQKSGDSALRFEDLLAQQMRRSDDLARQLGPALQAWQAARERLWYRGQLVLHRLDDSDPEVRQQAVQAVRKEVGLTAMAAQALSRQLQAAAEERAAAQRERLLWGLAALLVLLGLLSLVVVEPTARAVAAQMRRQLAQDADMRRLALVAEHTSAMVLITDAQDRIQWANAAFTQVSGWQLHEVMGKPSSDVLHGGSNDAAAIARLRDALLRGVGLRQEWLSRTRDGRELWLDVDLRPLHDSQGTLTGTISVSTDISARVAQQAKLQALWSALPVGVLVHGGEHQVLDANRAAENLLGLSLAQLQGLEPRDRGWRVLREDGSDYPLGQHPALRTLVSGEPVHNETIGVRRPDAPTRWLMVNSEPQRDALGQVSAVLSCLSDVTERRALQDQLKQHARTDALTQLPNRAAVMERLQHAIAHASRNPGYGFALLFMDFDRFKQVNDTMGHGAGDELLRQIAQRLQMALRPGDALARLDSEGSGRQDVAARIGGDEFVVVLEGVNSVEAAAAVAERVLKDVSEPYLIGGAPLHSSASIGVVLHRGQGDADRGAPPPSAEEVLRNADTAMYEAKRGGRGRWVLFDHSMHERVVHALEVEADLRRALKEDELFVVYQPVVDLRSRSLTGVEALVRWRHPERGLVPPVEFIGVAEEAGLIDEVGTVVLRKACQQFVRWRTLLGDQAPGQLAVNLSRAQLKRAGMVDELRAVLESCGMQPEWLQLEVTESLAAQDEPVQATLRQLKALGLMLALDDFGTGYSSLACLHQLPVDTVKVDRSFVQHAQTVEYHRVLIEATIRVARTLGMKTVAEGIETEGQADLMLALQCDRGQGYLYSRPLEAAALEQWVRSQSLQPA